MMLPPPVFFISGMTALTPKKIDLTFTFMTRSNSSAVTSKVGLFLYVVPALLTTISGRPLRPLASASFAHAAMATSQSASLVTSSLMWTVVPPALFNVCERAETAGSLMSASRTCEPSCANRVAIAAPKPDPAPMQEQRVRTIVISSFSYQSRMIHQAKKHYAEKNACMCSDDHEKVQSLPVTRATFPLSRVPAILILLRFS
jgi:hypothetical protein